MPELSLRILHFLVAYQAEVTAMLGQGLAPAAYCMTYGQLGARFGLSKFQAWCVLRWRLRDVAVLCERAGVPHLNSLVVSQRRGRPGDGYANAGRCRHERWADDLRACIMFDDYQRLLA